MSALEQALADYLQLRRSLGHDLTEAGWLLPRFVAYLDAHGAQFHERRTHCRNPAGPSTSAVRGRPR